MALQVLAFAFVIIITAMQALHGLFSGMIMVMCSIVAAVVALGFFEPLNDFASQYITHPNYAAPGVLVASFLLTLIILRLVADSLVRGNIRLPRYVDLGGSIACGFVSAQIVVGILMMGLLMLPLGERVMMYEAIEEREGLDVDGRPEFKRVKLWTNPNGFVASLVGTLSSGSLRAKDKTEFNDVYPDFPQWVAWSGNTVQVHTYTAPTRDEKTGDGFEALKVAKWWDQTGGVQARYRITEPRPSIDAVYEDRPYQAKAGNRMIGVTLEMGDATLDRGEEGRQVSHRFRPTMLRIVGKVRGRPMQYFARIIGNADEKAGGRFRIANMKDNFATKAAEGSTTTIDAYFEVDQDFTPAFVEYRRFARAGLTVKPDGDPGAPGDTGAPGDQASTNTGGPVSGRGGADSRGSQTSSGIMSFVDAVDVENSGDMDDLPFSLNRTAAARGENPEFDGRLFESGRIFGDKASLRGVGPGSIRRMKVPDGFRICQIRYSPKKALSLAGRVFRTAGRTLNQYSAVDENGSKYLLAGYYAIVKRGDKEHFEIFFKGGPDSIQMNFRGMLDFKEIRPSELTARDDAVLGLIFLVPKGVTITGVENQKGAGIHGLSLKMRG